MMRMLMALVCLGAVVGVLAVDVAAAEAPDFNTDVLPVFRKYCNGCHNARELSAELVLEDFARTMQGGENGRVIVAGKSAESRLWSVVSGAAEPRMPPETSAQPKPEELALIRQWIDAGAKEPAGGLKAAGLVTPRIATTGSVREPITALAIDPQGRWLAQARPNVVEVVSVSDQQPVATLTGHTGAIADVQFSPDGSQLAVAAGETGLNGEVTLWKTSDFTRDRTLTGHVDSLYAVAFDAKGQRLATASYDREAKVWDLASGKELVTLKGHNDAVYDLAFHPGGRWIATASGDRTVKLWDTATGERLDTFSQPAKEQYSVSVSPDGRLVAAGGVDNRVRIWQISDDAREGTSPILYARFAHEAPILRVQFSPNGRLLISTSEEGRIKVWETQTFTQVALLERQPDWPSATAFTPDSQTLFVGRMDGSVGRYAVSPKWADTAAELARLSATPQPGPAATDAAALESIAEVEPNNIPDEAQRVSLPTSITGVLHTPTGDADSDLFRFTAQRGDVWMLETNAARSQSPADTKLEILHPDGRPVRRALLQAVRDSWINFRPIDSSQLQVRVEFWEEMDLNQYLYMNGEVGKFYRAPRGPDSGYDFYDNRGKRRTYFDTTPMTHAKDQLVYIVEAYPPEAPIIDNGLPVFPLDFVNDDDGERELGSDSRLTFTAPADGDYLVRVTDARGFSGPDFKYTLTIRRPQPGFRPVLDTRAVKLPPGSGQRLKFYVDRIDNFDGPIQIDVRNLPPGYAISAPTVIEAGHLDAYAVLTATAEAEAVEKEVWQAVEFVATADIGGQAVSQPIAGLTEVTLEKPPAFTVTLTPDDPRFTRPEGGLMLTPGKTITAMIRVERNGFDGDLKFDVDNLPHGVIVDNIGLSGVLVRKGETERQIFLTARPWVPASQRWIHATAQGQGNLASTAIPLEIVVPAEVAGSE